LARMQASVRIGMFLVSVGDFQEFWSLRYDLGHDVELRFCRIGSPGAWSYLNPAIYLHLLDVCASLIANMISLQ
jgi:hypothetical protein